MYDLVIVGAGPAGMTAAIYAVRANLNTLMLDKLAPGGQIVNTNGIENFPGAGKIDGADLAYQMFQQCEEMGVEFDYKTVEKVTVEADGTKKVHCVEDGSVIASKAVILALGAKPRRLHIENEQEYAGNTISWCAICDGAKYRDQDVVVIGGGNSAVDESIYLAGMVRTLTVVTDFDLTGDARTSEYLRNLPNVTVYPYKKVEKFVAEDGKFYGVQFSDKETLENRKVVKCDGVFEYIGNVPSTDCVKDLGISNKFGFIETDELMNTRIKGIFAVGDCRSKWLRQIVTSCGDGAIASEQVKAYIKDLAL